MRKLFIIVAPSGAGKTTLVERIIESPPIGLNLEKIITYTTREPRSEEVCGKDYYFISRKEFEEKIKNTFFIEHSFVYNNYYGSSFASMNGGCGKKDISVIAILDFNGAQEVKINIPSAITVFIQPPSYSVLEQRIIERDQNKKSSFLNIRLAELKKELDSLPPSSFFDYIVSQGPLEAMIYSLGEIIKKESDAIKKDKK